MNKKEQKAWRKQWGFKEPWIGVEMENTLAKTNQVELAWAAGFCEGEGSIFINHQKHAKHPRRINQTTYPCNTPYLTISQVSSIPIFRFAKAVGGRKPSGPYYPKNNKHSPYYRWDACGRPSVHSILVKLWPFFSDFMKNKVHLVWKELENLKGKKSPFLPLLPQKYIGVDLDGTLAECISWQGYGHIGEPIPLMLMRVKGWIRQGKTVKIFTSRVEGGAPAIRSIHQWLKRNGLPKLEVTNIKDSGLVELWDDLAVKVEANTGETCCPYRKNWKVKITY